MKTMLLMLAGLLLLVVPMVGCDGSFGDYFNTNPNAGKPIAIHEDDDEIPDAYAQDLDNDGVADTDADGTVIEVPGSRDAIAGAEAADTGLSALVMTLGSLIPVVGVAAGYITRMKPIRRFQALVRNVQAVRDKAKSDGSLDAAAITEILANLNGMVKGLNEAVADAKKAKA